MTAAQTDVGSTVHGAVRGTELALDYVVKNGLEVIEEDCVGGAFEHERKPPVGVDATASCDSGSRYCSVRQKEADGQELAFWSVGNWGWHRVSHTMHSNITPNRVLMRTRAHILKP